MVLFNLNLVTFCDLRLFNKNHSNTFCIMKYSIFALLCAFWPFFSQAQSSDLLRYPDINKDGSLITFSFQGDIWTVPGSGGKATRLTIHEGYEAWPKFSPDGVQIAFSGDRFGSNDVFVIPTSGGAPKRLTYHSSGDNVSSWNSKGEILFTTAREFRLIERPLEIYSIAAKGGTERRVLDAVGFDPVTSPDGRFVAFVRGDINPIYREDYKGPSDRDIWMYDSKNDSFSQFSDFAANDVFPQWGDNSTMYFMSSEDGNYNLYRSKVDENGAMSGSPEQLTTFKDHSIRHFSLSADGKHIVFERESSLFVMNTSDKTIRKVNVEISTDDRFDAFKFMTFSKDADEYAVAPNGKHLAFVVRGEVFVSEANKEKSRSVNVSNHSFRDMNPAWLNDSTLIFVSDREDETFNLYMVKSADSKESNFMKTLKLDVKKLTKAKQDISNPVISNNGKMIAYNEGRGKFIVGEIDEKGSIRKEKTLHDGWETVDGATFSPDDKWLAYSRTDLNFNTEIFIHAADNSSKPVNVTMHPRGDYQPSWSPDGSKLAFVSGRNNLNNDIWFVWLKKADWERTTQDWDDYEAPKPSKDKKDKSVPTTVIDFENIHERLVQVTSFSGDEQNPVFSKDGETIYFTGENTTAKGNDLFSIKWNGKDLAEITKGGSNPYGISPNKEYSHLYYFRRGGSIARIDIKSSKSENLPFVAKMRVDFQSEREQVFEEAWRTLRDGFYDPNFHGYDWNALGKKYKPLVMNASTSQDMTDIMNLMLGELNASHMRFSAPTPEETQNINTGWLGAELTPDKNGMKVVRVVPGTPVSRQESKLYVGDVIVAVDGQNVDVTSNFYQLLNAKVNERVLLEVQGADKKTRDVVVRPSSSIRQNLYDEWVQGRKKLVDQYSKGKLGYIHIQGMNQPSFETFERELTAAGYGKEGIVIDVRYNGGGWTTDYLMSVLNYKQHSYTIPRGASDNLEKDKLKFRDNYPLGERLVFAAWTKPSIALCNEGSYSNAEIFSHAYQSLGIGTLVGKPTNGSVISTGGKRLMDGSFVRLPFRAWFTKATDKNQELGPAVPDIDVDNNPNWIAKNTDVQLKTAVEELLKQTKSK